MGTEGNGKSIRQVLQAMIQPDPDRAGAVIAHAAFWLVFQVLAFLLYSAAIPGFFPAQHSITDTRRVAAISLPATIVLAVCERRFNRSLLPSMTLIVLGIWVIAFLYLINSIPLIKWGEGASPG